MHLPTAVFPHSPVIFMGLSELDFLPVPIRWVLTIQFFLWYRKITLPSH